MMEYDSLIKTAYSLGACSRLTNNMQDEELAKLLFTPQGREFCVTNDFPKSQDINHVPDNILILNRIFKGKSGLLFHNPVNVCLVNSDAEIKIKKPEILHHIVLLDKSCLKLIATNHCVVSVDVSRSSYVEIEEDSSSSVYVHGPGKVNRTKI